MSAAMKIDFVSDVSCPWCIIGLRALEQALASIGDDIDAAIEFQPFELNPTMPAGGQDLTEHMQEKYGASAEQSEQTREMIRARGEELGFTFRMDRLQRIYNTFDTHRVLHWANLEGRQYAMKRALFDAYFTEGKDPSDPEVLVACASDCELDPDRAKEIVDGDEFADEVRARERFYTDGGIHAVPAVIINDRHLIQGGQPVEVFEQALRQIAEAQSEPV